MQRLEVSGAVRPIYGSLGVKRLNKRHAPTRNTSLSTYLQQTTRKKGMRFTECSRVTDS